MFALYRYWREWPPTHEVNRLAWLKTEEKKEATVDGAEPTPSGDVGAFIGLQGVEGKWVGPPPFKAADVMELAARNKAKQNGR